MFRVYATLIETAAAGVFIVPVFALGNKLLFRSRRDTPYYVLFGLYLAAICGLVGFPNLLTLRFSPNVNWIPLRYMINDLKNAGLNVLLFLPFGVMLPMLWPVFRSGKRTAWAGLDEVKQWIAGRLCAFCGNSGVGKSTLLNHLLPEAERETSAISQKLGRGRHTTREVTIFEAFGGRIADTPGFASLEANRAGFIPKENLEHAFPEFGPYLGECQFTGCSHRSEKGCAVRAALAEGKLSQTRYDSYCAMYEEVKDVKDWQRPKV